MCIRDSSLVHSLIRNWCNWCKYYYVLCILRCLLKVLNFGDIWPWLLTLRAISLNVSSVVQNWCQCMVLCTRGTCHCHVSRNSYLLNFAVWQLMVGLFKTFERINLVWSRKSGVMLVCWYDKQEHFEFFYWLGKLMALNDQIADISWSCFELPFVTTWLQ